MIMIRFMFRLVIYLQISVQIVKSFHLVVIRWEIFRRLFTQRIASPCLYLRLYGFSKFETSWSSCPRTRELVFNVIFSFFLFLSPSFCKDYREQMGSSWSLLFKEAQRKFWFYYLCSFFTDRHTRLIFNDHRTMLSFMYYILQKKNKKVQ